MINMTRSEQGQANKTGEQWQVQRKKVTPPRVALRVGADGYVRGGVGPTLHAALATDAAGQLDVLGHDRHALGVDRAQVGVLEEADQVRLGRLLQGQDGRRLEAQVRLELLRELHDQALERQLADQELRGLLVLADLTERHRARAEAVGLLDATSSRGGLAGRLCGQLLAGRLAADGLAGSLLGAGHCAAEERKNRRTKQGPNVQEHVGQDKWLRDVWEVCVVAVPLLSSVRSGKSCACSETI